MGTGDPKKRDCSRRVDSSKSDGKYKPPAVAAKKGVDADVVIARARFCGSRGQFEDAVNARRLCQEAESTRVDENTMTTENGRIRREHCGAGARAVYVLTSPTSMGFQNSVSLRCGSSYDRNGLHPWKFCTK